MKKYLILCLVIALTATVPPLCIYNAYCEEETTAPQEEILISDEREDMITVFLSDKNTTTDMPLRDYIIGVVAAEMPAVFEPEALSAQAVVSLTLVKYMSLSDDPGNDYGGAVISTDSKKHQAYFDDDAMKERWQDNYDTYYNKICTAVDKVMPYVITYEDKPILAAFHAISPGRTESSGTVWLKDLPYLTGVESEGDSLCHDYKTTVTLGFEEFKNKMSSLGVDLTGVDGSPFADAVYSDSGTLISVKIGNKTFSGSELREIFSLRSAAVTPEFTDGNIIFNVKGYGHGVGMSQYGADYYARQGKTWQEIIEHYYPGTTISKVQ